MKREKIGLVLNGGAARSFFQLGVIKSLIKVVNFDIVVGSGWGAYFAALLTNDRLECDVCFEDFLIPEKEDSWSFFSNQKILENLKSSLEFSHLSKKLVVVTTDLENDEEVVIDRGNVKTAVEGAIAFPCFNKAVLHENKFLVDGSLTNPFPTDIAWLHGADKIIAIDTISQHIRDFDENNVPVTPYIKNAALAFTPLILIHKEKISWMEMRMLEASLTAAIDDYYEVRKPHLTIKLEEEAPELARKTYLDSFDNIPLLIEVGITAGKKYASSLKW